jgi:hypothetical protein
MTINQKIKVTRATPTANPAPSFTAVQIERSTFTRFGQVGWSGTSLVGIEASEPAAAARAAPGNAVPQFEQ